MTGAVLVAANATMQGSTLVFIHRLTPLQSVQQIVAGVMRNAVLVVHSRMLWAVGNALLLELQGRSVSLY